MFAWQRLQPSGLRIFRDLRLTTPKYAHVLASGPVWQPVITKEPPADSQIATTMVTRSGGYIAAKQLCAKARRSLAGVAHCDHDSARHSKVSSDPCAGLNSRTASLKLNTWCSGPANFLQRDTYTSGRRIWTSTMTAKSSSKTATERCSYAHVTK